MNVYIFPIFEKAIFQQIHSKYGIAYFKSPNTNIPWCGRGLSIPTPSSLAGPAPIPPPPLEEDTYFCEGVFIFLFILDRQLVSNKFPHSMHQIAEFEPPKCKKSLVWEGGYPPPTPWIFFAFWRFKISNLVHTLGESVRILSVQK